MGFDADRVMERLDALIARQVEAIRAHPTFRAMEGAWCAVAFVVQRLEVDRWWDPLPPVDKVHRPRVEVAVVPCTLQELTAEGLRAILAWPTVEPGAAPWGLVVGCFEVGASDAEALGALARVADASHVHLLFGADAALREVAMRGDSPGSAWEALRESPESERLGVCLHRVEGKGGAVAGQALLACLMARSFARYGSCANSVGPDGRWSGVPAVSPLSRAEAERVADAGWIAIVDDGGACLPRAPSLRRVPTFGPGEADQQRQVDARLAATVPYRSVVDRFAHTLIATARALQLGGVPRTSLEHDLSIWAHGFVTDSDVHPPRERRLRPLRKVLVRLDEEGGFELKMRTRFKLHGAFFTLAAKGRLPEVAPRHPPPPTWRADRTIEEATFPLGDPLHVALAPDGETAWVASGTALWCVERTSGRVLQTRRLVAHPFWLGVERSGEVVAYLRGDEPRWLRWRADGTPCPSQPAEPSLGVRVVPGGLLVTRYADPLGDSVVAWLDEGSGRSPMALSGACLGVDPTGTALTLYQLHGVVVRGWPSGEPLGGTLLSGYGVDFDATTGRLAWGWGTVRVVRGGRDEFHLDVGERAARLTLGLRGERLVVAGRDELQLWSLDPEPVVLRRLATPSRMDLEPLDEPPHEGAVRRLVLLRQPNAGGQILRLTDGRAVATVTVEEGALRWTPTGEAWPR